MAANRIPAGAALLLLAALALSSNTGVLASRALHQQSSPIIGKDSQMLTAVNTAAMATGGVLAPPVPPSACDNTRSPDSPVSSGSRFSATLSGLNNVKPNATGVLMPVPGPSSGTYLLVVDETGKKASWTLTLCDTPAYVAAHLHTGSKIADFAPPLVPLEPYVKAANPFAPPNLLPQLCPPLDIKGCSYTAKGSFKAADIAPLLGRQPQGDLEAPLVVDFAGFLDALKQGKIYVNVHSKTTPAGLMRGNLAVVSGSGSGSGNTPASG